MISEYYQRHGRIVTQETSETSRDLSAVAKFTAYSLAQASHS